MTGGPDHGTVKDLSPDRTGVMIVRLWIEPKHEAGLRARITSTLDATDVEHSVAAGASADEICDVVKEWVDAFARRQPQEPEAVPT